MSKEVDKRILEMEFDNKQFESGVKQTRESIAKLNEDLQFRNASSGIQKVQDAFNRLDFSRFAGAFDNLRVHLSGIEVFAKRIIENLADSLYSGVLKVKQSIMSVYGMISQGGSTRAQNIEQAKFQLEGLHVAWDDIKDDINYAVKDTAYGLDSAAKAASQLVASNIQIGEEMRYSLRGISGLAAMTNSTYEDIARIFTKVAGQGRLMGDDLLSVASRGINVAAELAKVFNVTEAEVRDMVSKGQVDFKTFAKAMDDAFGQHAKDANKTYAGSLSNVKAALSRLGADIATTKFEALRDIFNDLIPKIDEFKREFKPAEEAIQNLQKKMGRLIQTLIKSVDVPKIAKKVSDIIVKVADKIEYLIDQFSRAINVVKTIEKMDAFKKIQNEAQKAASAVGGIGSELDKINSFANAEIIDNTREFNKELQAAKDIVSGVYGELNGQARIDYVKDVLGLDPDVVQDYINQVYDGGKTWDEVVLRAGDNADTVNEKYSKLSETIKGIVKTFSAIKHVIKNVITSIKNVAKVLFDSFTDTFSLDFGKTFGDVPKTITEISDKFVITEERASKLRPVFDTIFGVIKKIAEAVKFLFEQLKKVFEWLKNNKTLQDLFTSIKDFFATLFDKFKELKDRVANSETFKKIKDTIKPILGEIGSFMAFVLTGVANIFKRATDMVTSISQGTSFFDALSKFLFGSDQQRTKLYSIIKGGFIIGFIWAITKALYKMTLFANDGIFYIFRFLSTLSNLSRVLVTYKYYLRASAFEAIAKGIGLVVLAIVGMAYYINKYGATSVMEAAIIIGLMITGLLAIMRWIAKVDKLEGNIGGFIKASIVLRSLGWAIVSVAGAIYFMASAVNQYGPIETAEAAGIILLTMGRMIGALLLMSKFNTSMTTVSGNLTTFSSSLERVGRVLLGMGISLLLVSKAITNIVKTVAEYNIQPESLWINGFAPLVLMIIVLTSALTFMTKATMTTPGKTALNRAALTILSMGAAMKRMSDALTSLLIVTADMELADVWAKGVGPIMALLAIAIKMITTLSKVPTTSTTLSHTVKTYQRVGLVILSISIAMKIIVSAMVSLLEACKTNKITWQELYVKGLLPIVLLIGAIGAAVIAIGRLSGDKSGLFTPGKFASLALVIVGIAGSLVLIIGALSRFLKMVTENNINAGVIFLRGVLPVLSVFVAIVSAVIVIARMVKGLQLLSIAASIFIISTTLVGAVAILGLITKVFDPALIYIGIGAVAFLIALIAVLGKGVADNPQIIAGLAGIAGGILAFAGSLLVLAIAVGAADVALLGLGIALPILASGIVDALKIIVQGIIDIIKMIPDLTEAVMEALSITAYELGRVIPLLVGQIVKGFMDGLGCHSPSTVFKSIGDYCAKGFFMGLFEGIVSGLKSLIDVLNTYIIQPVLDFFGIHSPSLLFIGIGQKCSDGLLKGFGMQTASSTSILETGLNKFKEKISGLLPDTNSLGKNLGDNLMDGFSDSLDMGSFDMSQFGTNMDGFGEAFQENAAEQIRGINLSDLYSLDDLLEDSSIYDKLKAAGETQLTAAYEDWQRHTEFMSKYPTVQSWYEDMANNYEDVIVEAYQKALAEGDKEMQQKIETGMLQNYLDQSKLDAATYQYMETVKGSIEKSTDEVFNEDATADIFKTIGDRITSAINGNKTDSNFIGPVKKDVMLNMKVQDETGKNLDISSIADKSINLDYDNSSVKTNMDVVSSDISSAINSQTTKLSERLTAIETKVGTFDTNQMNRTNNIVNRVALLEGVIKQMRIQLDTGALVGQLVAPMDEALGREAVRKARG